MINYTSLLEGKCSTTDVLYTVWVLKRNCCTFELNVMSTVFDIVVPRVNFLTRLRSECVERWFPIYFSSRGFRFSSCYVALHTLPCLVCIRDDLRGRPSRINAFYYLQAAHRGRKENGLMTCGAHSLLRVVPVDGFFTTLRTQAENVTQWLLPPHDVDIAVLPRQSVRASMSEYRWFNYNEFVFLV